MTTQTPPRPRLKHVMTATAFNIVNIKLAWKEYFRAMRATRRQD